MCVSLMVLSAFFTTPTTTTSESRTVDKKSELMQQQAVLSSLQQPALWWWWWWFLWLLLLLQLVILFAACCRYIATSILHSHQLLRLPMCSSRRASCLQKVGGTVLFDSSHFIFHQYTTQEIQRQKYLI